MKIDQVWCQCDRCKSSSGRMSQLIYNHANGDFTQAYHLCRTCEDDFHLWYRAKTPHKYIEAHNASSAFGRKMFKLKDAGDVKYIEDAQEFFGDIYKE